MGAWWNFWGRVSDAAQQVDATGKGAGAFPAEPTGTVEQTTGAGGGAFDAATQRAAREGQAAVVRARRHAEETAGSFAATGRHSRDPVDERSRTTRTGTERSAERTPDAEGPTREAAAASGDTHAQADPSEPISSMQTARDDAETARDERIRVVRERLGRARDSTDAGESQEARARQLAARREEVMRRRDEARDRAERVKGRDDDEATDEDREALTELLRGQSDVAETLTEAAAAGREATQAMVGDNGQAGDPREARVVAEAMATEAIMTQVASRDAAYLAREAASARAAARRADLDGDDDTAAEMSAAAEGLQHSARESSALAASGSQLAIETAATVNDAAAHSGAVPSVLLDVAVATTEASFDSVTAAETAVAEAEIDATGGEAYGPGGEAYGPGGDHEPGPPTGFDSEFDPDEWSYVESEGLWYNAEEQRFYMRPDEAPVAPDTSPAAVLAGASLTRDAVDPNGEPVALGPDVYLDPQTGTFHQGGPHGDVVGFHKAVARDAHAFEPGEVGYSNMTGEPVVFAGGTWYREYGPEDEPRYAPIDDLDRYVDLSLHGQHLAGGDYLRWEVTSQTALFGVDPSIPLILDGATGELHSYDPTTWEWVEDAEGQGYWTDPEGGRYDRPSLHSDELADGEYSSTGHFESHLDTEALTMVNGADGVYWYDARTGAYSPYHTPGAALDEPPQGPFTVHSVGEGSPPPLDQYEPGTPLDFDPDTRTYQDPDTGDVVSLHPGADGASYTDPHTGETVAVSVGGQWFDSQGEPIEVEQHASLDELPEPVRRAVLANAGLDETEQDADVDFVVDGATGIIHRYDPTKWKFDEEAGAWIDQTTDAAYANPTTDAEPVAADDGTTAEDETATHEAGAETDQAEADPDDVFDEVEAGEEAGETGAEDTESDVTPDGAASETTANPEDETAPAAQAQEPPDRPDFGGGESRIRPEIDPGAGAPPEDEFGTGAPEPEPQPQPETPAASTGDQIETRGAHEDEEPVVVTREPEAATERPVQPDPDDLLSPEVEPDGESELELEPEPEPGQAP